MARAMVLCAGYGTRLRPLTDELPKPLIPLGDRPLLAHVVERIRSAGHDEIVINTHHLADEFSPVIGTLGVDVQVVREPQIRGTAGGIAGAVPLLEPPFVAWNGDILADVDVADLLASAGIEPLRFVVVKREGPDGIVGLGAEGHIVRLRGEIFGAEVESADYLGIAVVGRAALPLLPETGCLVGDVALPLLRSGAQIPTHAVSGPWTDLGDPKTYALANRRWLTEHVSDPRGAWLSPSASVDPGVELLETVVGAGARVTGGGSVERCIIWPGARVRAPLRDAIVTPGAGILSIPG